jgi:hypothetical protein
MHPVIVVLGGWLVAQPAICAGWAYLMRDRRHLGGN